METFHVIKKAFRDVNEAQIKLCYEELRMGRLLRTRWKDTVEENMRKLNIHFKEDRCE